MSTVACLPCIDWRACGTIVKPTVRLMSNLQQTSTSKEDEQKDDLVLGDCAEL